MIPSSNQKELKTLIIHGCLHILGYDHVKDDDFDKMKVKESFYNEKP